MSLRPLAVCAILICAAGCYKQEQVNAVQHPYAWQREAGQSEAAAANVAKQSDLNSQELAKAMQSGDASQIAAMQGKLVKLDAELTDQSDSIWTLHKEGWVIQARISDLTPHSNIDKSQITKCGTQGIIESIDPAKKTIVLADVELALK